MIKDFPGNYTDYRQYEKEELEKKRLREESLVKTKAPKSSTTKSKEKTKLTYAEQIEWQGLEEEIEKLEEKKLALVKALQEAASDAEALQSLGAEMQDVEAELEAKEMRWLELSEYVSED